MIRFPDGAVIKLPKDRTFTTLFAWGISLFIVAVILVGLSWIWAFVLFTEGFNAAIDSQVIIDSKDSEGFDDYKSSIGADIPPFYEYWYFYNLTNVDETLAGGTPNFQQLGPYIYSQIKIKLNISFLDNSEKIAFRECQSWIYESELSTEKGCIVPNTGEPCDPDQDLITNLNPGYMGAVAAAGGEVALTVGFTGPSLQNFFDFLQGEFLSDTTSRFSASDVLENQKNLIMSSYNGTTENVFYEIWGNYTTPPPDQPEWKDMVISQRSGKPSNISYQSSKNLYDPSIEYSLLSKSEISWKLWGELTLDVNVNRNSDQFKENIEIIKTKFKLNDEQALDIIYWLHDQFYPNYVHPFLIEHFQVEAVSDLAYLQWGKGTVTPGLYTSVQQLYPEKNFPTKPEFALFNSLVSTMDYQNAKKLLNGPVGIFNPNNIPLFFGGVFSENITEIEKTWGLSSEQQVTLFSVYFFSFWQNYAINDMANVAGVGGGGLFATRTPNQMAWSAIDPLLLILQPESADVKLQGNDTSISQCIRDHPIDYYWTGKKHISRIGEQITYDGMEYWPQGWYAFNYKVHGVNSEGQFEPNLSPGEHLEVFDNNFFRTLALEHFTNTTLKGDIYTYRYTLAQSNFLAPQPAFYSKEGFQGICNVTGPNQGAPIFLSQAHFLGADPQWINKLSGVPKPNFEHDPTLVDIEPYTGKVVRTDQALQVNLYINDDPNWFGGSPYNHDQLINNILYPIAIIRQFSELRDSDADQIRDTLYLGFKVKKILFGMLWGLGVLLTALSITFLYLAFRRSIKVKKRSKNTSQQLYLDDNDLFDNDSNSQPLQIAPYTNSASSSVMNSQNNSLSSSSSSSSDDYQGY